MINLQESPAKDLFASSASSFLFIGSTNGSRWARAAAIVKAGLRHWKIDPIRSIFPIFGSNGRVQRWQPVTQNSSDYNQHPKADIQYKNLYAMVFTKWGKLLHVISGPNCFKKFYRILNSKSIRWLKCFCQKWSNRSKLQTFDMQA